MLTLKLKILHFIIELFNSFPEEPLLFVLKHYSLQYRTRYEPWRNLYVFRPEGILNGTKYAARCYVQAIMGQVKAIIAGGQKREAINSRDLFLDGSFSRDYSKSQNSKQFSRYSWDCESHDDYKNPVCHRNVSQGDSSS